MVVSFAINLASAYAKTPLDRVLNHLSARRRQKSDRAQREIAAMLEKAKHQKDGVVLLSIQELRLVVMGIALVVFCILLLLMVMLKLGSSSIGMPLVLLVPLLLLVAFIALRHATKIAGVLKLYEAESQSEE